MYSSDPLWLRLKTYHPDKSGVELPFSHRLARENGWNKRFALRAIDEYKRFVYLACTSSLPVTPSEEVDQVWHLHLIYSKLYWEDFCGKVLQQPLHHSPTEGGKSEGAKYMQQYEATLQAYKDTFGETPPMDLWPPAGERFAGKKWRWINLDRYWVIAKWLRV
jgi:hypothetical protein